MLKDEIGISFPGTAYVHGIKHAKGDFIIIMDADLSHHVSGTLVSTLLGKYCNNVPRGVKNKDNIFTERVSEANE